MSFTHETLISALRDVIREEIKTYLDREMEGTVGSMLESNGTFCSLSEKVDRMSDFEDRIDTLESDYSSMDGRLDDCENDYELDNLKRDVRSIEETLENNDLDQLQSDVRVILRIMGSINTATNEAHNRY